MAEAALRFLKTYDIPGFGFAVAREGQVLHEEAFGLAERETKTALTPAHRFRIASVSKPITAAAIFRLIALDRLRLDARAFGPGGLLAADLAPVPAGSLLETVSIDHLLTHTVGVWSNKANDPMFRDLGLDHAALIARTLRATTLDEPPGRAFAYSNFGYCLLGRIIETVTGQPYDQAVQALVLEPAGADGMAIAGNTLGERQADEVRYYAEGRETAYGLNVRRMDSHGGWLARPAALARFASNLVPPSPQPLLTGEGLRTMLTPSAAYAGYAKGWRINPQGNAWHTGHLSGTTAMLVRARSGLCWAALLNTRQRQGDLDRDLDRLLWTMVRTVPAWKA